MKYALYYNITGKGHDRGMVLKKTTGQTPREAFEQAVEVVKAQGYDPDTFKAFYVAPTNVNLSNKEYNAHLHGWSGKKSFPVVSKERRMG